MVGREKPGRGAVGVPGIRALGFEGGDDARVHPLVREDVSRADTRRRVAAEIERIGAMVGL